MGNQVTCVDIIPEKIERLKQGILPIYEPGLEEMVERNVHAGRLHFTTSYQEGLDNCEFIFIAVNTPTGTSQGERICATLRARRAVSRRSSIITPSLSIRVRFRSGAAMW